MTTTTKVPAGGKSAAKRSPKISPMRLRIEAIFTSPDATPDGYSVEELAELFDLRTRFVGNTIRSLLHNLTISLAGKDNNGKQRYKKRETIVSDRSTSAPIRSTNRETGTPAYWSGYFSRMNTPRLTADSHHD